MVAAVGDLLADACEHVTPVGTGKREPGPRPTVPEMSALLRPRPRAARRPRTHLLRGLAVTGLAACSVALAAPAASATARPPATVPAAAVRSAPAAAAASVSRLAVSFTVRNVNRSTFACASDGKTYTVRGHLVGPSADLAGAPSAVTLYLHGLNFAEYLWQFTDVPGYDYATDQAKAGQTSLIVDRLGYGASDKPAGNAICAGSRADIAHQMVQALRSGDYRVAGQQAPSFRHVALAGHSYGGQIAELEAYSFGDIDALAVVSYTDQGSSALAASSSAFSAKACAAGGQPVAPGGPGGYAPFGNPAGAKAAVLNDATPVVAAATLPRLTLNPCGDMVPFAKVAALDLAHLGAITVPVLEIVGGGDQLFPASAGRRQAALFTGSPAVDLVTVPGAGHAITLQRGHDAFTEGMRTWLESVDGFAGSPAGGVETGIGDSGTSRPALLGGGLAALAAAAGFGAIARRRSTGARSDRSS